jgi:cbb3-type cytochrome oxidase subunit 3
MSSLAGIDMGTVRGVIAAILFVSFVALWMSTFSKHKRREFEKFSRIPLDEDVSSGGAS